MLTQASAGWPSSVFSRGPSGRNRSASLRWACRIVATAERMRNSGGWAGRIASGPWGIRMLLAGKRALVTGSSAGIGLGVAQAFVENGASVVVSSERPLVECPDVVHLLKSGDAHYIQADMSRPGDPERLVGEAWDRLG